MNMESLIQSDNGNTLEFGFHNLKQVSIDQTINRHSINNTSTTATAQSSILENFDKLFGTLYSHVLDKMNIMRKESWNEISPR